MTPTETITVIIENNDVYAIGFDRETIALEEGASAIARLGISPAPSGASTVPVALSVSDKEQLTAEPEELVFSATSQSFDVVVTVIEDAVPELRETFTVSPAPLTEVAAVTGAMSVVVPGNDTPTVRVRAARTVIPEGAAIPVFVDAAFNQDLNINMAVSGLMSAQTRVSLSPPSLTLSADKPSASFSILVEENSEPQGGDSAFNVNLTVMFTPQIELPPLTFTIPPNDLIAYAATRVEFTLDNQEAVQTMTVGITPLSRGDKSFIVFSEDPRLMVKTGLITPDQSSFPIELAAVEGLVLGREEQLSLSIIHLDSWRQRSAQAQLGVGAFHNCGIKADGAAACWGSEGQTDPLSSPQVDANTRFLGISAGVSHTCGIKTDGAAACWGLNNNNQANPMSSPQGVDDDTRFLALGAGFSHTCGIKADGRMACWGSDSDGRTDPPSGPQGVDANTRFLALGAGFSHTCGIKADSRMACWGDNASLQSNPTSGPQDVDANARFLSVSAGFSHTCAIKADGRMACWGSDSDGRTDPPSGPQGVDANTRFLALDAGFSHTCAIKADSRMACWGDNASLQSNPTSSEQNVDANTIFLAIGAGGNHSCGIRADGAAACWGANNQGQSTPTSDSFARTPDTLMLAERATALTTQDGEEAVQFNEVTEVESLRPQLTLNEGETTTLTLFRVLSGPANPITITLAVGESGKQFLSLSSTQLTIAEEGGAATASLTAVDNENVADIDPVSIALSVIGDNIRLTPTETIAVAVEDDDIYTIGFDRETITLEEGLSETARLSLSPAPVGANTVAVALSVSDNEQLTVKPEEVVFSAASANQGVVITVTEDAIPESEEIFTVSLRPQAGIPVMISSELSVIVPADDDTTMVRAIAATTVIPEGAAVFVLVDADINRDVAVNLAVSGLVSAQPGVSLSASSLTLRPNAPTSFSISVADNEEPQAGDRTFNVDFSSDGIPRHELPSLPFTIPPNDLAAHAAARAEFAPKTPEQTLTINITPQLRDNKSFIISSEDRRLIVKAGLIASAYSPLSIELELGEDALFREDGTLSLSISHVDSWRQRSAQAQLGAGTLHSCGIKADSRVACWGFDGHGRASPASAAGVDANTGFLAVSAGDRHSCGIKADGAAVCWGLDNNNQANPASAAGVDANTSFFAVSAGALHTCGIKADGEAACWGFDGYGRASPASAAGVAANTKFLALSAGHSHSCGIKADSTAVCWGFDGHGRASPASAAGVDANTKFLALSAGRSHSCGIKADGGAACWGFDGHGRASPASAAGVDANTKFLALSAGHSHSCGIKADGGAACWGRDRDNQANPLSSPQGVAADARFLALSSGYAHTCAIKTDGSAVCWGLGLQRRTDPPSLGFAQTPDTIRLAEKTTILTTRDGERVVRVRRNFGFLSSQLALDEGESAALPLLEMLADLASPIAVTLEIEESDERFLSISPAQIAVSEAGEIMTIVTAIDNDDFAGIEPINITLNVMDSNATFTEIIAVSVENDDVYTIGFDLETITLEEEGVGGIARLSVSPTPIGDNTAAVALSVSDSDQLSVNPEELVFSAASTVFDVTVAVTDDDVAEPERTFTVSITPLSGVAAVTSPLSVIASADGDFYAIGFDRETITLAEGMSSVVRLSIASTPANSVTVALSVSDSDQLSVEPEELVFSAASTVFDVIVAVTDDDVAELERTFTVSITPLSGVAAVTSPLSVIASADGDFYAIGFDRETITLAEGMSSVVRLSIASAPASSVTVALSVSDSDQLSVEPEELVFSAASTVFDVIVAVTDDDVAEPERAFTVSITPLSGVAAVTSPLSVIAPADNDRSTARVFIDRTVIPEGTTALVLIDATLSRDIRIDLSLSGSSPTGVSLSASSLTLSPTRPSALFSISVADNEEPQGGDRMFNVDLSSAPILLQSLPSSLAFIIPPNDLMTHAVMPAEFTLGEPEQSITINTTPPLRGGKSFIVSSEDPRIIVKPNIITFAHSPFPVELALNVIPDREETLSLSIVHLDGWQRRSAQAQLSAGDAHSCGIKADGAAVCWGRNAYNQANPVSSPDVDADTRFLALSSGDRHSCGIKANGAVACWGFDRNNQTSPTSSLQGVDANTRFLALSAGALHNCGIKADSVAACWGDNDNGQINPMSGPQGVDANTRFLGISAGDRHSCGIKADGAAVCWGDNRDNRSNPLSGPQVDADTRFSAISVGDRHSCGIKTDGAVACWGDNSSNPLSGPQVDANTRFLALSAGSFHTCGIKADGAAVCWGHNVYNQSNPVSSPDVDADTRFLGLSAGSFHTCGIKTDGAAVCWGINSLNQASPPTGDFSPRP